ncbi:hypothetical protein ABZ942_03000 [Nocardia sp. NPDC046473]|uniref:hypothetical protein n=1 Tax=Nocardia sp. NPDC046473 TaxID=3155733 RepID=UPI0034019481
MSRRSLCAAAALLAAALAIQGCAASPHTPANADASSATAPDVDTIDRVLESPATAQLAASFLRSQNPPTTESLPTLHRTGPHVMVYATNPSFATDPQSPLDNAGTPSYIAIPTKIDPRTEPDTVQLDPTAPYAPRAIATGTEESQAAQALPPDAQLLLDYPSHTWFAWTETHVTAISSSTYTDMKGREFDTNQFKQWLASR